MRQEQILYRNKHKNADILNWYYVVGWYKELMCAWYLFSFSKISYMHLFI